MRRALSIVFLCTLLAGCANTNQWDVAFRGHTAMTLGVPQDRMGVLFGSIAIEPRIASIVGVSLHFRPLGDPGRETMVLATSTTLYARRPDVDEPGRAVWLFSGQMPAGAYEITRAQVYVNNVNAYYRMDLPQPVRIDAPAAGTVYLGRWQVGGQPSLVQSPRLTWPGVPIALRDAFAEDGELLLAIRRKEKVPHEGGAVVNPLPSLFDKTLKERWAEIP